MPRWSVRDGEFAALLLPNLEGMARLAMIGFVRRGIEYVMSRLEQRHLVGPFIDPTGLRRYMKEGLLLHSHWAGLLAATAGNRYGTGQKYAIELLLSLWPFYEDGSCTGMIQIKWLVGCADESLQSAT